MGSPAEERFTQRADEKKAHKAKEEATRRAAEEAERGTLRQLLDAYVGHLEKQGKKSAPDVRSIFNIHVLAAAPDIAARKASDVKVDDFVRLIGKLTEVGKGRTAGKLRSYLRAAYSLAIASKTDSDAPMVLHTFGVDANPVASVGAQRLSKSSKPSPGREHEGAATQLQCRSLSRLTTCPFCARSASLPGDLRLCDPRQVAHLPSRLRVAGAIPPTVPSQEV